MNSVAQLSIASRQRLVASPALQPSRDLLQEYRQCGGAVTGDQMVGRMACRWPQPLSRLARWVVERRVIHFHSAGSMYLPLFQFDLAMATPRTIVLRVLELLPRAFDDDEVAEWFALPSCLLTGDAPAHALASRPDAVFEAARAMRFLCQ